MGGTCGDLDELRRASRRGRALNVTARQPGIGLAFIRVFTRCTILPGNGNYRYYLNAGIISDEMDRIVMGAGLRSAVVRHGRGNRW